jgi:alpha-D-xyloside xylohydrolase
MHNLYLFLFTETCFQAAQEVHGANIVWRRAGYIGSQRYPGTWAGDTQVSWQAFKCCLRGGLSAGLTGEAFWASDIGGFTGPQPSSELYIRWAQMGFLSGLTRFHGNTPREPWHYGETAVKVVRHYARMRYKLIPYLLATADFATRTGMPLMRHMRLEFENEPNVATLDDQYMLGTDLLVAPVFNPEQRSRRVYLPEGTWRRFENPGRPIEGGRFILARAPLERVPVFVRAGAVIPQYTRAPQHLKGAVPGEWTLDLYPGAPTRRVTIPENGFGVRIDYRCRSGRGRLTIARAPITFTVRFIGVAVAVESRAGALPATMKRGWTEVRIDAAEGVTLNFTTKAEL